MPEDRKASEKEQNAVPVYLVKDKRRFLNLAESGEAPTDAAEEGEAREFPSYVEELHEKLRASEARVQAIQEKYQQAREELRREAEEMRTRLARQFDQRVEQAKVEFFANLLEGIDNLERAISVAETNCDVEATLNGLLASHALFMRRLGESGLEQVSAEGVKFDPEIHEAVEAEDVFEDEDGIILARYQKGYTFAGRLVRPARVKVGRGVRTREKEA